MAAHHARLGVHRCSSRLLLEARQQQTVTSRTLTSVGDYGKQSATLQSAVARSSVNTAMLLFFPSREERNSVRPASSFSLDEVNPLTPTEHLYSQIMRDFLQVRSGSLGRFSGLDFSSARRAKFLLPLKSKRVLELLACVEGDECKVPVEKGSIVWAKSDWVKAVGLFCSCGQRDDDDDGDGDDEAVLAV
ncbi:uncharacterized [Tachysurus ichikawai]